MYPLADGMFAPRNQWYVAAWSSDVTSKPTERWILDEPIAFYRKADGAPVALHGRCPHRSFPLGKSRVVGDDVECGYHGLRFGPDGQGVLVPSQVHIPRACKVHAYPVAERWQWIWIWPGDPELADESLIPDHWEMGLTDPKLSCAPACYNLVPGRYMLLHDNLFDLTHIEFLHKESFGAGTRSDQVPHHTEGPNWLASRFEQYDIDIPPFMAGPIRHDGKVDRSFGLKLFLPSLHFGSDIIYARKPNGDRGEVLGDVRIFHAITPATRTSCHYFFAAGHGWSHLGPEFLQGLCASIVPGIEEDVFAVSEIEAMIQHQHGRPREIRLEADHVCMRGRRLFEKAIKAETAEAVPETLEPVDA